MDATGLLARLSAVLQKNGDDYSKEKSDCVAKLIVDTLDADDLQGFDIDGLENNSPDAATALALKEASEKVVQEATDQAMAAVASGQSIPSNPLPAACVE
ncbi:MAG: hypothetical protein EXQ71_06435 [Acidimicrobiia bacterium]|nr:hypothetical protein [Acidimicrobiia bacterium]